MNLRKATVRSDRKVFNGSKVEPVFNSRSMVLEGDLKLGRTMGLLTPKIFYSGWLKSDHPVISIQRLGSPAESRTVVNDSHYVSLAARKLSLRFFKIRPFSTTTLPHSPCSFNVYSRVIARFLCADPKRGIVRSL